MQSESPDFTEEQLQCTIVLLELLQLQSEAGQHCGHVPKGIISKKCHRLYYGATYRVRPNSHPYVLVNGLFPQHNRPFADDEALPSRAAGRKGEAAGPPEAAWRAVGGSGFAPSQAARPPCRPKMRRRGAALARIRSSHFFSSYTAGPSPAKPLARLLPLAAPAIGMERAVASALQLPSARGAQVLLLHPGHAHQAPHGAAAEAAQRAGGGAHPRAHGH